MRAALSRLNDTTANAGNRLDRAMYHHLISGVVGGIVGAFALAIGSGAYHSTTLTGSRGNSIEQFASQNIMSVDRTLKMDKNSLKGIVAAHTDFDRQVLFNAEPLTNVTVVAQGSEPADAFGTDPIETIAFDDHVPVQQILRERWPVPAGIPVGCESAFGALSESTAAQTPSRCLSNLQSTQKLASNFQ
jgi:hypothetical protein